MFRFATPSTYCFRSSDWHCHHFFDIAKGSAEKRETMQNQRFLFLNRIFALGRLLQHSLLWIWGRSFLLAGIAITNLLQNIWNLDWA